MKKKILLAVLFAALLAAGVCWQVILESGLNSAIREYAAPAFQKKTGAALEVRRARVRLLSGSALLEGVAMGNPAGFDEPAVLEIGECNVQVGLAGLARGGIERVKNLAVKKAVLTIVRNAEGERNLQKLAQSFAARRGTGGRSAEKENGGEQAPAPKQASAPRLHLAGAVVQGRVVYIDHAPGQLPGAPAGEGDGEPFSIALDVGVRMKDVATFGEAGSMNGSVALKANLASSPSDCVVLAFGKVAPLIDPNRPTFDLDGKFDKVALKHFKPYLEGSYVEDGSASGEFNLVCREGRFDPEESRLILAIEKPTLSAALRRQFGGASPEKMKITAPIGGTVQAPEIDFKDAVKKALSDPENLMSIIKAFSSQGTNAGSANVEGEAGGVGEVQEAVGGLLRGLKNGERGPDGATSGAAGKEPGRE